MKLKLNPVNESTQLKYRVNALLKQALDEVHEECNRRTPKVDFTSGLEQGLWEVVKALRLALGIKPEPTAEPKAEPKLRPRVSSTNGADPERA